MKIKKIIAILALICFYNFTLCMKMKPLPIRSSDPISTAIFNPYDNKQLFLGHCNGLVAVRTLETKESPTITAFKNVEINVPEKVQMVQSPSIQLEDYPISFISVCPYPILLNGTQKQLIIVEQKKNHYAGFFCRLCLFGDKTPNKKEIKQFPTIQTKWPIQSLHYEYYQYKDQPKKLLFRVKYVNDPNTDTEKMYSYNPQSTVSLNTKKNYAYYTSIIYSPSLQYKLIHNTTENNIQIYLDSGEKNPQLLHTIKASNPFDKIVFNADETIIALVNQEYATTITIDDNPNPIIATNKISFWNIIDGTFINSLDLGKYDLGQNNNFFKPSIKQITSVSFSQDNSKLIVQLLDKNLNGNLDSEFYIYNIVDLIQKNTDYTKTYESISYDIQEQIIKK